MNRDLSEIEARIVGSLLEKEVTTPEYYPLSLNALTLACNQKTNREPVMSLSEETVAQALDSLRRKGLVTFVREAGSRVEKYRQRLSEVLNLDRRELALLYVLILRGPQTTGELKERSQRLYGFDDLAMVELCLRRMIEREPDPLVAKLDRSAGSREPRYAHLLSGTPRPVEDGSLTKAIKPATSEQERIVRLESEVALLKKEVADLRAELAEFRGRFE
jgi:uncharacterized protein YceH (UPF0502 family)